MDPFGPEGVPATRNRESDSLRFRVDSLATRGQAASVSQPGNQCRGRTRPDVALRRGTGELICNRYSGDLRRVGPQRPSHDMKRRAPAVSDLDADHKLSWARSAALNLASLVSRVARLRLASIWVRAP
jgi:hypothetical protein